MRSLSGNKILLFGASGMLGKDVVPVFVEAGAGLEQVSQKQIDITDASAVRELVAQRKPDWIVNCAAYTAVDDAETEYAQALAVNATGVANLARAALEVGVRLLHISTDYVFGGVGSEGLSGSLPQEPFLEDDRAAPCGMYGHSKYYGEELLQAILPTDHLILRTSWLHGVHGKNFVDTMLRLGAELGELKVVDDQRGSPTWTPWLADVMARVIAADARGVFHACSRGNISWHEFAAEIFEQARLAVQLGRQTTEEMGRPAPRPRFSTLAVGKLEQLLGEPCIDWRDCVARHLAARAAAE